MTSYAFLFVYMMSLGCSGGIIGAFGHRLLVSQGFAGGAVRAEIAVSAALALFYIAAQLLYMAFLRIFYPSRPSRVFWPEAFSQSATLVLIPYLIGFQIDWPKAILAQLEPLFYLAAFGVIHLFFKCMSLYAAVSGRIGKRSPGLIWLASSVLAGFIAWSLFLSWRAELVANLPEVSDTPRMICTGHTCAMARTVPEGVPIECPIEAVPGACLEFRWALPVPETPQDPNAPDAEDSDNHPSSAHISVTINGADTSRYSGTVTLRENGWAEFSVPANVIGEGAKTCTLVWSTQKRPLWSSMTGLPPLAISRQTLLMSGPFQHQTVEVAKAPSIVMVVFDGLSADHVSCLGYARETTPNLDKLAAGATLFPGAYTPSPESPAGIMTLLTGLGPLRHGFLAEHAGPLPEGTVTLAEALRARQYATAAFTEGDDPVNPDLQCGSGVESGFEFVDATHPDLPPDPQEADNTPLQDNTDTTMEVKKPAESNAPGQGALERAAAWLKTHDGVKSFVFIRVRELTGLSRPDQYGNPFGAEGNPSRLDQYDAAIRFCDQRLGTLLDRFKDDAVRNRTCITVTASCGMDFPAGPAAPPQQLLSEPSLRVPLIIAAPSMRQGARDDLAALEDVAPTLLALADAGQSPAAESGGEDALPPPPVLASPDGRSLLEESTREPVSMMGKPLVLSVRSGNWRFAWRSNQIPFAARSRGAGQVIELIDLNDLNRRGVKQDMAARRPDLVKRYQTYLETYLDLRSRVWTQ